MVAGQRQRVLDHGDGVAGHRQLDDVGFDRGERLVASNRRRSCRSVRIDGKPCLDAAEDFLHPRWSPAARQICRNAVGKKPVSQSRAPASSAVIDRGDEDRVDGGLGDIGVRHSSGKQTSTSCQRKDDVVEDDIVAAAGAGRDDPRFRRSVCPEGRPGAEYPDPRLGLVGSGPDRIPFQDRAPSNRSCATQPPAGFGAPRQSLRAVRRAPGEPVRVRREAR